MCPGGGEGGGGSIFWKTPVIGLASYNNLSTGEPKGTASRDFLGGGGFVVFIVMDYDTVMELKLRKLSRFFGKFVMTKMLQSRAEKNRTMNKTYSQEFNDIDF